METIITDLRIALARDVDTAFPELVRARQHSVYSGVLRIVRNPHDAADITQDTFIRAYRALSGYDPQRIRELKLEGWLWTIAVNLCRNRGRSRAPVPSEIPDRADPRTGTEDEALERAGRLVWEDRLAALPAPQRTAVVLRHVVGLSYDEIASATSRPVGTTKTDVHRGIARLRKMLEAEAA